MNALLKRRMRGALNAMPAVFCIAPRVDYSRGVSRTSEELMNKAWSRTNQQMVQAFRQFEAEHANVVQKISENQAAR